MKSSGAIVVLVICLALCAQEAYSLPWWKRIPPPPTPVAPAPSGSGSLPQLPKWFQQPTADEIAKCQAACSFDNWMPCRDESIQERRTGNFTIGPACCGYLTGVVNGCYSKFLPEFEDVIYPPRVKEICSKYH